MYQKEPVRGYEEYQVDTNGIVYSKKGKPLKYSVNPCGYAIVNFMVDRKRVGFAVHTLVAKQFLRDHPIEKNQVNHIDGNKLNNNINNLEWTTPLENTRHAIHVLGHTKRGINNPAARSISAYDPKTQQLVYSYESLADAARALATPTENFRYLQHRICQVATGRRHEFRGLVWRYTNQNMA